jgi:predicted  nucleic acid-binding Zn-ribbon protein
MQPAEQLFALQRMDTRLAMLRHSMDTLDPGESLETLLEQVRSAEAVTGAQLKETQTRLRDLELSLSSTAEKAKKIEQELYSGRVGNPKELTAMQEDVASLGRQRRRIEDEMLALMEDTDRLARELGILEAQRGARERELEDHLTQYRAHTRALEDELAALQGKRETQATELAPEVLKRYERLRERKDGLAVAQVLGDGICEGCHVKIPDRLYADLQDGDALRTCEECGRILYAPRR